MFHFLHYNLLIKILITAETFLKYHFPNLYDLYIHFKETSSHLAKCPRTLHFMSDHLVIFLYITTD